MPLLNSPSWGALRRIVRENTQLADRIIEDKDYSNCDPEDIILIRFVQKLTRTPQSMAKSDIAALRDAGFEDEAIVHITEVASYFNYVNRLALTLGVDLEV